MKSDEILAIELEHCGTCCVDKHGEDYDDGTCPELARVGYNDYSCVLCWLNWARKKEREGEE